MKKFKLFIKKICRGLIWAITLIGGIGAITIFSFNLIGVEHLEIGQIYINVNLFSNLLPVRSTHREKSERLISADKVKTDTVKISDVKKPPEPVSADKKDVQPKSNDGFKFRKFIEHITVYTGINPNQGRVIPSVKAEVASQEFTAKTKSENENIFTSYLKDTNSKNIHAFKLDSLCAVNIEFTASAKDNASYVLTVRDSSENVLTRKMIYGETLLTCTGNLYLCAGNYTVSIERGYSWSGKPYTITVNSSKDANTEREGNNSIKEANIIPLNEKVRASTGTRDDIDYFTFTLDRTCYVSLSLEFAPVKTSEGAYYLRLYELAILNTDKKPFVFRGDGKPSKELRPFILEAGKYIIAISRLEDTKLELGLHEYTLRVEAKELM